MSNQGARDANAKLAHQSLLNAVERANRLLERLVDLTELGVVGRTLSVSEGLAPYVESDPLREVVEQAANAMRTLVDMYHEREERPLMVGVYADNKGVHLNVLAIEKLTELVARSEAALRATK